MAPKYELKYYNNGRCDDVIRGRQADCREKKLLEDGLGCEADMEVQGDGMIHQSMRLYTIYIMHHTSGTHLSS